jgi:hypothetical protein
MDVTKIQGIIDPKAPVRITNDQMLGVENLMKKACRHLHPS